MDKPENHKAEIAIETLAELRDKISAHISILENNTARINDWLNKNHKDIILSYQKLTRAIDEKNETKFISVLKEMEDLAGFVLKINDIEELVIQTFGYDCPATDEITKHKNIFPEHLEDEIEEFSAEEAALLKELTIDQLPPEEEDIPSSWRISSWFKGKEIEEKRNRLTRMKELYEVKSEIMGIQSDRHYYLDGVMDWVIDGLAPEAINGAGVPADTSEKMIKYQNPAYIIDLAQADYKKAVDTRVKDISKDAFEYSKVATAIDHQDFDKIKESFENLYLTSTGFEGSAIYDFLMEDYSSKSLFDIVFKHIDSAELQEKLFALDVLENEKLKFNWGQITPLQIFGKFLDKALSENYPMSPRILPKIAYMLKKQYGENNDTSAEKFLLSPENGEKTLERIYKRFSTEPEKEIAAYEAVMEIAKYKQITPAARLFVELNNSNTGEEAIKAIENIAKARAAESVMAFWELINYKGIPRQTVEMKTMNIVYEIKDDMPLKIKLLEKALSSGMLSGLNIGDDQHLSRRFINEEILSNLNSFPIKTARSFIHHIFSSSNDVLEDKLASKWLAKIVGSDISSDKKTQWIAAFLEPVKSDIVKANILYKASENISVKNTKMKSFLLSLEQEIIGDNITFGGNKLFANIDDIANIWYNEDSRLLNYTVNGQSIKMIDNLSSKMAKEILSLIKRRSKFGEEQGGLFKAENISNMQFSGNDNQIAWYNSTGTLNIDSLTAERLRGRRDFMQVKAGDGKHYSYNAKDICLLEKISDRKYIIIDKYGVKSTLEGDITLAENTDLLDVGKGIKFNPSNASIVRLSANDDILEFRIESREFDEMLENEHNNEALYSIAIKTSLADNFSNRSSARVSSKSDKYLSKVRKALDQDSAIYSSDSSEDASLWFNINALDFIQISKKPQGVNCKRYSYNNSLGFIGLTKDKIESLLENIGNQKGIIKIGNLLTSAENIDNIYYDVSAGKLQVLINGNIREIETSLDKIRDTLIAISKKAGFYTSKALDNVPIDIINYKKATLLNYDEVSNRFDITVNRRSFYINATREEALELFSRFIPITKKKGLKVSLSKLPHKSSLTISPKISTRISDAGLLEQSFARDKETRGNDISISKLHGYSGKNSFKLK